MIWSLNSKKSPRCLMKPIRPFEKNFLSERTKKFEAELFQVTAQLKRTSNAKLDEMLSL